MQRKYLTVTDPHGGLLEDELTAGERAALIALAAIWSGHGYDVLMAQPWSQAAGGRLCRHGQGGITVIVPANIGGEALADDISHATGWRATFTAADRRLYICPTGSAQH